MDGVELQDDEVIEGITTSSITTNDDPRFVEIVGSSFNTVQLTGLMFDSLNIVDTVFSNSELSGVTFAGDSRLLRVRFVECRLSGVVMSNINAQDVTFERCKLDGANFRMSKWSRAEFNDCEMHDADFGDASLTNVSMHSCRLQEVNFNRVTIKALSLHGSELDGLKGATSLAGVSISSAQILPLALPILDSLQIKVTDE